MCSFDYRLVSFQTNPIPKVISGCTDGKNPVHFVEPRFRSAHFSRSEGGRGYGDIKGCPDAIKTAGSSSFPSGLPIENDIAAESDSVLSISPGWLVPISWVSFCDMFALGISAYGSLNINRNKVFFSVWSYYVITLVPVLGIVQVGQQSMADRSTYLPSLGPFLVVGLVGAWISRRMTSLKKGTIP